MTHQVLDRVQELITAASIGTGALTLNGANTRMRSFSGAGFADGETFLGLIEHSAGSEWEIAVCTYHSGSPGNVTRATPLLSSTGSAIAFSAGIKTVSLIAMGGPSIRKARAVTSGTSTAMTALDFELILNKTVSAAHAVTLPPSPVLGQECVVSDGKGDLDLDGGGTISITVTGPAAETINGSASHVLQAAYQSTRYRFNGTGWNIVA